MKNVITKILIGGLAILLATAAWADTTKTRKETWSNGVTKSDITEYYDTNGRKFKEIIEQYDKSGNYVGKKINFFDEDFITLKTREKRIKDNKTEQEKLNEIYNFEFGNKVVKIERKITDEPSYGAGCKAYEANDPSTEANRDAHRDYQRKLEEEKNGPPKSGKYWVDFFNFLDDYACTTGVTVDKDNLDRKKTYRYRMSKNFDLKVQKWTPAAEYFLNKKKTKSVEFIFYDRKLTPDSGGPMLKYKIRF